MNLSNLQISLATISAITAAIALVGAIIWWLIRIRQKRVWFPIVRILRIESRQLPKLRLTWPPLVSFLAFVMTALTIIFFTMQPRQQIFTPFEPDQTRIHIFVDLSPSVAGHINLNDLVSRLGTLVESLKAGGRVTVSTSHSQDYFEVASRQDIESKILALGWHRPGLRIGSALKRQTENLGDVDRLFIMSDRNQHSWDDFNWKYLLEEMDVLFVDLGGSASQASDNFYINKAHFLSAPFAPTMDWDIEIGRSGGLDQAKGVLKATYRGKQLASIPWTMAAGRERITIRASWAVSNIESSEGKKDEFLLWKLTDMEGDAIELDNDFRSPVLGSRKDILQISESKGEQILEDGAYQLKVILEVLGFRVKRHDHIKQPGPKPKDYPLWIITGGYGRGVDQFCPKSIVTERIKRASGSQNTEELSDLPKVWLSPASINADYGELCWCYHRLLKAPRADAKEPVYCKDVTNRTTYINLLKSIGASQVGGSLGAYAQSLAWIESNQASGLEVLAFTIPLHPSLQTGLSHATLPVLVRDLLKWQKVMGVTKDTEGWPRFADISAEIWPLSEDRKTKLLSNIPLGESIGNLVSYKSLPPRWSSQVDLSQSELPVRKDKEDPLPWLKICAYFVIGAMALEVLWHLISKLIGFSKGASLGVIFLASFIGMSESAEARVEFSFVGFNKSQVETASLAKEISHRTSVEVAFSGLFFDRVDDLALEQPWLWLASANYIPRVKGKIDPKFVYWLKRGGILIIENSHAMGDAERLMDESLFNDPRLSGWQAIPPDHVLMRSFYLLDSLPVCNNTVWKGFTFDKRMAVLSVPFNYLDVLNNKPPNGCPVVPNQERLLRVLVNTLMVSLATDYKKDQIHLPEILKRLR